VLAVGCGSGQPASTSSWQGSTERALGELISGLGTARLVVEHDARGGLPHSYAVVTMTDSIESSSRKVSGYLVGQPPDRLHAANATVTTALQEAQALLVETSVAIASPGLDRATARRLVDEIDAMRERLDRLDTAVKEAPGSVGRR